MEERDREGRGVDVREGKRGIAGRGGDGGRVLEGLGEVERRGRRSGGIWREKEGKV